MLKSINAASMELNRQGYALYEQKRYDEAYWNYWGIQLMVDAELDSLRSFDTGGANYFNSRGWEEYVLLSGGKALIKPYWGNSNGPVTEGYFCVIGEYVFMFFDVPGWEVFESMSSCVLLGAVLPVAVPVSKFSFKEVSEVGFYGKFERLHK
ncbi:MAG: hypothetical protein E4H36_14655 [Spirochaetales bacterium]|nr:MAG: hypothetical protein E4H36_14655 [Spirochaetales bacterium]